MYQPAPLNESLASHRTSEIVETTESEVDVQDKFVKKLANQQKLKDRWNRKLFRCSACLVCMATLSVIGGLMNVVFFIPHMPKFDKMGPHHERPGHREEVIGHGPPPPQPFEDWEEHPPRGDHPPPPPREEEYGHPGGHPRPHGRRDGRHLRRHGHEDHENADEEGRRHGGRHGGRHDKKGRNHDGEAHDGHKGKRDHHKDKGGHRLKKLLYSTTLLDVAMWAFVGVAAYMGIKSSK